MFLTISYILNRCFDRYIYTWFSDIFVIIHFNTFIFLNATLLMQFYWNDILLDFILFYFIFLLQCQGKWFQSINKKNLIFNTYMYYHLFTITHSLYSIFHVSYHFHLILDFNLTFGCTFNWLEYFDTFCHMWPCKYCFKFILGLCPL